MISEKQKTYLNKWKRDNKDKVALTRSKNAEIYKFHRAIYHYKRRDADLMYQQLRKLAIKDGKWL